MVEPYNFNVLQPGPISDTAYIFACGIPKLSQRPKQIATTPTTISISWNEPTDNGGCTIQGYSIHIDDGYDGEFSEVNAVYDTNVRNLQSLSAYEIKRISYDIGKTYRILVKAYNLAGLAESPILGVEFATNPDQPA